jgi:RNA-directed DNA polymerase
MRKQQMITERSVSASSATWSDVKWQKVELNVYRLQMRIAKAVKEQRHNKVKALPWRLTHSLEAKLRAVN